MIFPVFAQVAALETIHSQTLKCARLSDIYPIYTMAICQGRPVTGSDFYRTCLRIFTLRHSTFSQVKGCFVHLPVVVLLRTSPVAAAVHMWTAPHPRPLDASLLNIASTARHTPTAYLRVHPPHGAAVLSLCSIDPRGTAEISSSLPPPGPRTPRPSGSPRDRSWLRGYLDDGWCARVPFGHPRLSDV